MKRRIALLLVLAVIFTALFGFTGAEAATSFQKVNFVNATVTGCELLNVRQGPAATYPIVCVLKKGQTVKVFGKLGNWYAIYDPAKGCVGSASAAYLKPAGATAAPKPTTPVPQAPGTGTKPTPKPAAPGTTTPPAGISQDEQTMLNLINKERAAGGLPALQFDMNLMKVARLKAKDMVDHNYFSHQSPTYGSPFDMMKQFGVSFKTAGENIAGNQTVEGAVKAWMNSPGHKANIMNGSFNYTGIGVVSSPTYGKMLVQQFIGR